MGTPHSSQFQQGSSVAINYDGTLIFSGAYNESDGQGAVYVLKRNINSVWLQKLCSTSLVPFPRKFRHQVVVDENGTTMAVSSLLSSNINNSVIVFKWSNESFYQPTAVLFLLTNLTSHRKMLRFLDTLWISVQMEFNCDHTPYYSNPYSQNGAVFMFREKAKELGGKLVQP